MITVMVSFEVSSLQTVVYIQYMNKIETKLYATDITVVFFSMQIL